MHQEPFQMVNYAVSSYLYISVPKSNTAYYTTGICKKQLLFLFFIECLEIIAAKDVVVWLFLGKRLRYRKYMIKIKRKNLGTENILFPRAMSQAAVLARIFDECRWVFGFRRTARLKIWYLMWTGC